MAKLAQEREKSRRLNNRLLASQRFAHRNGYALENIGGNFTQHFAENDHVANRAHRLVRSGGFNSAFDQFVTCAHRAAQ